MLNTLLPSCRKVLFTFLTVFLLCIAHYSSSAQAEVCTPDCQYTPFTGPYLWLVGITIPPCPDPVWFEVTYYKRYACSTWYDVQITGIRSLGHMVGGVYMGVYSECSGVRIYPEQYFQAILKAIMEDPSNPTGFPPFNTGECVTNWRVTTGACQRVVGINPGPGESFWQMKMLNCDSTICCLTPFKVCKNADGTRTATPIGSSVGGSTCPPADPTYVPVDPHWDGLSRPCQDVCGWAGWDFSTSLLKTRGEKSTIPGSLVVPNPAENALSLRFSTNVEGAGVLTILANNGVVMFKQQHNLSKGENSMNINTHNLTTGAYLYRIEHNGQIINQGSFIINK